MTRVSLGCALQEFVRNVAPKEDCLEVLGGHRDGKLFALTKTLTKLGRSSSNDITLAWDRGISLVHAQFIRDGNQVRVEDLSGGETAVDGKRVNGKELLRNGGEIRVGNTLLVFKRSRSKEE